MARAFVHSKVLGRVLGLGGALLGLIGAGLLTPHIASATSHEGAQARAERLQAESFSRLASVAPDSRTLRAPVLATGRLIGPTGRPLAGATVLVALEPSNETLAALPVGGSAPVRLVARSTTTSRGEYTVRAPSGFSLAGSLSREGDVNLQVISVGAGWTAQRSVGTQVAARSSAAARPVAAAVPTLTADLRAQPAVAGAGSAQSANSPMVSANGGACLATKEAELGPIDVVVGQSFSQAKDVTANFVYGQGQKSSLGVGSSVSGKLGTWSVNGSVSVSTSGSEVFAPAKGATNRSYLTEFVFAKFRTFCTYVGTTGHYVRAVYWAGGATHKNVSSIKAGKCVRQEAGSTAHINKTKATALGTAVKTSSFIGIDLSAQTGYSSTAQLTFHFPKKGHPFCGESGYPNRAGERPGRVQVHASVLK